MSTFNTIKKLVQSQLQTDINIQNVNSQIQQLQKKLEEESNLKEQKNKDLMELKSQMKQLESSNLDLQNQLKQYTSFFSKQNEKKHGKSSHKLKLITPIQRKNDNLKCSDCQQKNPDLLWNCQSCEYNLCLDCMQKKESKKLKRYESFIQSIAPKQYPFHDHNLELVDINQRGYRGKTNYQVCGQNDCKYYVCCECMQKTEDDLLSKFEDYFSNLQRQLFPLHNHPLQVTIPSLRSGENGHMCDNCQDDGQFFMWSCKNCTLNYCLECTKYI